MFVNISTPQIIGVCLLAVFCVAMIGGGFAFINIVAGGSDLQRKCDDLKKEIEEIENRKPLA